MRPDSKSIFPKSLIVRVLPRIWPLVTRLPFLGLIQARFPSTFACFESVIACHSSLHRYPLRSVVTHW